MIGLIKKLLLKLKTTIYLYRYDLNHENTIFTHLTSYEKITLHKTIISIGKKNINCAEIGSYLGASSCFIANALDNSSSLFCIDTWENDAMIYHKDDTENQQLIKQNTLDQFINNTALYNSKIKRLQGWSYDVASELKIHTNTLDFLFIDGDHSYEGVKKDWVAYKGFLVKDSIVAFHDVSWADGVNRLITEEVKPIASLISKLPNLAIYRIS